MDESVSSSTDGAFVAATSRLLEIVANRYQFFTWLLGSTSTAGTEVIGDVPFLRDGHIAPVVVSVSDNGGEYQVTTDVAHNLVTGNHVFIAEAKGVTGLNGDHSVTVIDSTSYTLDGSTYQSGYVANSARAAGPGQIARAIWLISQGRSGSTVASATFRNTFLPSLPSNGGMEFCCLNQYAYTNTYTVAIRLMLSMAAENIRVDNYGGYPDLLEARIGWPTSAQTGTFCIVGELWGANGGHEGCGYGCDEEQLQQPRLDQLHPQLLGRLVVAGDELRGAMAGVREFPFPIVEEIWDHALDNTLIDENEVFKVEIGSAKTITGVTNASPVVITTSAAHGWSTGMTVFQDGIQGNRAANGFWRITVVNATQYSLDGSQGNGTYTSGGAAQRKLKALGKSNYLGMVRVEQLALPWNPCSGVGEVPGGSARRIVY